MVEKAEKQVSLDGLKEEVQDKGSGSNFSAQTDAGASSSGGGESSRENPSSSNSSPSSSGQNRQQQPASTGYSGGGGADRKKRPYQPRTGGSSGGGYNRVSGNFRGRRRFIYKKKFCYFTKNKIPYVDYKDVKVLKRFLGKNGQILSPRLTGLKPIFQRKLAIAVKRARFMALLPFAGEVYREPRKEWNNQRDTFSKFPRNAAGRGDHQEKSTEMEESQVPNTPSAERENQPSSVVYKATQANEAVAQEKSLEKDLSKEGDPNNQEQSVSSFDETSAKADNNNNNNNNNNSNKANVENPEDTKAMDENSKEEEKENDSKIIEEKEQQKNEE